MKFMDLFNNIGDKLKKLAIVCAVIFVVCGVIMLLVGFFDYMENKDYIEFAAAYGGAGYGHERLTRTGTEAYNGRELMKMAPFFAVGGFLSAWPLYGFGELIEKVTIIADAMQGKGKSFAPVETKTTEAATNKVPSIFKDTETQE